MSKPIESVTTSFRIPVELMNQLDVMARKIRISRSQLMVNLLEMGIEDAKTFDALKLFAVINGYRDLKEGIRKVAGQKQTV